MHDWSVGRATGQAELLCTYGREFGRGGEVRAGKSGPWVGQETIPGGERVLRHPRHHFSLALSAVHMASAGARAWSPSPFLRALR